MQIPMSGNEGTMADTAQHSDLTHPTDKRGRHIHHGRTLAAWTGSLIGLAAFVVGGIAVVIQVWPLFWASVGLAAIALIATVVLQRMGYGAN
jgi:Family of unknown function (DUF6704)